MITKIEFLSITLIAVFFVSCSNAINFSKKINQKQANGREGDWIIKNDTSERLVLLKYKQGVRDGKFLEYHKNGVLSISGNYKMGKKNGKWKTYNEDGVLVSEIKYKNGNVVKNKIKNTNW